MSDFCPFCLVASAEHLDGLFATRKDGFPPPILTVVEAARLPLERSLQDGIEMGRIAQGTQLPVIEGVRVKLYFCTTCKLRFRLPQVPVDVLYRKEYLRDAGRKR